MRDLKHIGIGCPKNWKIVRFKDIVSFRKGLNITKENLVERGVPVISYGQIHSGKNNGTCLNEELLRFVQPTYLKSNPECLVKQHDFIFADTSEDYEGCGNCVYVNESITLFAGYHTIIATSKNSENNNKYLAYQFLTDKWRSQIRSKVWGIKVFSVNKSNLANAYTFLPPLDVQTTIANFLDCKCTDIDNALEKTKSSIEEYKRLKQSLITNAVTKGIRGDRVMKDSGIEWIGSIPEDWSKYRKLSSICSKGISYGIVKLFDPDENGVKVLRCSDVQPGYILTENIRTVTKELSNEYKRTILNGGEIVINVRGTLGGCAIVPDSMRGYNIAREVALVDTFGINKKYLMYFFLSDLFKLYQQMNLAGSVYVGLNIELLSSCPILKPSLDEQQEIAEYLDKKCSEIDSLIASKEKFITELEAYKKSLIYEYVTGKKEVL